MHVFSGVTVNPGVVIGKLLWGGAFSEAAWRVMYFSTRFFLLAHIDTEPLLR